ncbi:integrase core domain-containing protein, partial [Mycoplasma leonicaptivi]
SSQEYKKLVDKINGKISMSRVGNSLDNREVEYFFSILKTECLYLNKIKEMTFKELKSLIESFIVKYNNERFQSNLNWKTPQETWSALKL